jgi:hypothetical protein
MPLTIAAQRAALALYEDAFDFLLALGPVSADDRALFARLTRALLAPDAPQPDPAPVYVPTVWEPRDGCLLDERIAQLGYRLTPKQLTAFEPQLSMQIGREWRRRYGEPLLPAPRWIACEWVSLPWLPEADFSWVDPIIQTYLSHYPGLARVSVSA